MIKRTLYFGNPAYLKTSLQQLVVSRGKDMPEVSIPIEDIGVLILDNAQITVTQPTLSQLLANNTAVITCNKQHHPTGLMLNLDGHTLQSQRFKAQIEASLPLKKQLWQQTISAKILNQSSLLAKEGKENKFLQTLSKNVKSGDADNYEAQAANYYWKNIFPAELQFRRLREGLPPNHLLNYGYAVLRAVVARSLVGSGLLPTLGIFHRNQYNAYCLADDIMEPYRPFVDQAVCGIIRKEGLSKALTSGQKKVLLGIPALDIKIGGEQSPLMVGVQKTTASLAKCFEGTTRKLIYPEIA